MTDSESKFKNYLNKEAKGLNYYSIKVPDFKATGNRSTSGLPDYLCIIDGLTLWFEVKMVHSKKGFNLDEIRESQWITFNKMRKAGADIFLAIYLNKKSLYIVPFDKLSKVNNLLVGKKRVVEKEILECWRLN